MSNSLLGNKDQVRGRAKSAKGKVKQAAGKLVGNKRLESEGKLDRAVGKAQSEYGDLKRNLQQDC